mmetsp:Transcript_19784/g.29271  ORF Transcript_19784/g.29271 Transcript_19784/m.29271 type:complete len:308 (-) Transcript_19784:281-1204(-)
MKFTTKALLLANAASVVVAFAPPRPHSSTTQTNHQFQQQSRFPQTQQQTTSSALPLFPDPSTLESSTLLTSDLIDSLVNTVGSLALLGSVGFGVFSGMKDEDWEYEYKAGNEEAKLKYGSNADLALIGMSEAEVAEDMVKGQVTEAQKSFFGKEDEAEAPQKTTPPPNEATPAQKSFFGKVKAAATPAPKEPKPSVPVVTAQPAKASNPSDTVLKATEVAKSEVQKKGVQETKQKMSSKSAAAATTSTPPSPAAETKTEEVKSEVTEVKKEKGSKRKLAKAATLVVAAGAVAVARNVVKAWLGQGMM